MARQLVNPAAASAPMELKNPTGIPPGMEGEVAGEEMAATPEEESQLEQATTKIDLFIHGRKTRDVVLDQLNQRDLSIPESVGRVAENLVSTLKDQASAAGVKLNDEILQMAGVHAIEELMEVGTAAGFFKLDQKSPEYIENLKLATLEGFKAHGEKLLRGPDAQRLSVEAQDSWARQVAQEVDAGTADPEFMRAVGGGSTERALIPGVGNG